MIPYGIGFLHDVQKIPYIRRNSLSNIITLSFFRFRVDTTASIFVF